MATRRRRNSDRGSTALLVVLGVVLIVLAVMLVMVLSDDGKKGETSSGSSSAYSSSSEEPSSSIEESSSEKPSSSSTPAGVNFSYPKPEDENESWYLALANNDNPLPSNFTVETAKIKSEFNPYSLTYDARAVEKLNNMLLAAKSDGVKIQVISAYRSVSRQTTLYNNKVQYYRDKGYAEAEAKTAAAKVVAVPGTSEHNLGLAVDLDSVEQSYENTKQFKWLSENAEKFGFVLRYPKDKQDITEIIYEPWHYRYVGVKAAKEMNDLDMCLEEYLEYLKK